MHESYEVAGVKPILGAHSINGWCVHSYYTLCPYAPDGSGRLLIAAADLENNTGEIYILSKDGEVLERFGSNKTEASFFHTGFWQTWSPDSRYIYYQGGSSQHPKIIKHEIATGVEIFIDGDMEGAPPFGEPIVSGLLGMLYAAGYGDGKYHGDQAPIPFHHRDQHGLFRYSMDPQSSELILSVNDVLKLHPNRDLLKKEDSLIVDGLTLMCYCVRWNPAGDRCLFYFGNHCVDSARGEPKLAYVFTADKDFKDIHLAVDLSFGKRGVHWSWHPDGKHLVGYGPDPVQQGDMCLAQVAYDGSDYKKLSKHGSGGHPSICPADFNLLVTDERGRVVFIDLATDEEIASYTVPYTNVDQRPNGRNRYFVCHHPVYNRDSSKVLINTLPGKDALLCELDISEILARL